MKTKFILLEQFIKEHVWGYAKKTGCKAFVANILSWKIKRELDADIQLDTSSYEEKMMIVGGGSSLIEYFCPKTHTWKYWNELPDSRSNFASAVVDNEMFIVGGNSSPTSVSFFLF